MKPLISYLHSSIGRKTVVALTGLCLILFVVGHMIGNLQIFLPPDWINSYAHKLQSLGPALWVIRFSMLAIVGAHILATISLAVENRRARPARYAVSATRASSAASRTMVISGGALLCFIIFHLLHFTVRAVPGHGYNEGIRLADGTVCQTEIELDKHWGLTLADTPKHEAHNVHDMMIAGFSYWYISAFYVVAMFLLCMHLSHGAASFVQTLGLRNDAVAGGLAVLSKIFAWAIFVGYSSIPTAILLGLVKPAFKL